MMKRLQYFCFCLTFGLFLLLLVTAGYYHIRHTMLDSGFWSPAISVDPLSVDFGDIYTSDDIRREVVVKNIGSGALLIEQVRPSCSSCIIIQSFPMEPIPPGKQGKIEFSLDVSERRGNVETSFAIISNVELKKVVVIEVTANVCNVVE